MDDALHAEIAARAMLKRRRAAEHSASKKRRRQLPAQLSPAAAVRGFSPTLSRFHPERAFSFQIPRAPCRDMTNTPAWWQVPGCPDPEISTAVADEPLAAAEARAAAADCVETIVGGLAEPSLEDHALERHELEPERANIEPGGPTAGTMGCGGEPLLSNVPIPQPLAMCSYFAKLCVSICPIPTVSAPSRSVKRDLYHCSSL